MTDNRNDIRTPFRASVKISLPNGEERLLKTRDMSHSGVFLNCDDSSCFSIGDQISLQSTDIDDAPVIAAEIVRIETAGFAVCYLVD